MTANTSTQVSSPAVIVEGRTLAGAACAAMLNRAGVSVSVAETSRSAQLSGLMSRDLLASMESVVPIEQVSVTRIINRTLREVDAVDWSDHLQSAQDLFVVDRAGLIAAMLDGVEILESPEQARRLQPRSSPTLLVDARDTAMMSSGSRDDCSLAIHNTTLRVQLNWRTKVSSESTWVRLIGEHLDELDATASIVTAPSSVTLVLSAPIAAIVETSMSFTDVLSRLLGHPAVKSEIPDSRPNLAEIRLLRSSPCASVSVRGGLIIRIGAAAGQADSLLLDLEIKSGLFAADQIRSAIAEDRVTVARLSRISRFRPQMAPAPLTRLRSAGLFA